MPDAPNGECEDKENERCSCGEEAKENTTAQSDNKKSEASHVQTEGEKQGKHPPGKWISLKVWLTGGEGVAAT